MQHFVVLNEASAGPHMSGMSIMRSIEILVAQVEALVVVNREFNCFTSDGKTIVLHVKPDVKRPDVIELARVGATVISCPERMADYCNIIYEYLKFLERERGKTIPADVDPGSPIEVLARLILTVRSMVRMCR